MAKLNQLDVSVVLKIKQLQNLSTDGEKFAEWPTPTRILIN